MIIRHIQRDTNRAWSQVLHLQSLLSKPVSFQIGFHELLTFLDPFIAVGFCVTQIFRAADSKYTTSLQLLCQWNAARSENKSVSEDWTKQDLINQTYM